MMYNLDQKKIYASGICTMYLVINLSDNNTWRIGLQII